MAVEEQRDRFEAEERLNDLFEPDMLLPTQFFEALKRKKFPCGEHRLLVALLRDAVQCFQKHIHARDAKRRQLYVDAEDWIGAEDDYALFSFNNVCRILGMNPDYVRQGLISWRDGERHSRRRRRVSVPSKRGSAVRIQTCVRREPTAQIAADAAP